VGKQKEDFTTVHCTDRRAEDIPLQYSVSSGSIVDLDYDISRTVKAAFKYSHGHTVHVVLSPSKSFVG